MTKFKIIFFGSLRNVILTFSLDPKSFNVNTLITLSLKNLKWKYRIILYSEIEFRCDLKFHRSMNSLDNRLKLPKKLYFVGTFFFDPYDPDLPIKL